jgi:hypothetical protein
VAEADGTGRPRRWNGRMQTNSPNPAIWMAALVALMFILLAVVPRLAL